MVWLSLIAGIGIGIILFIIFILIIIKNDKPSSLPKELISFWERSIVQKDEELALLQEITAILRTMKRLI
jgi:hypothetical protein